MDALIGSTGFVGQTLSSQLAFDAAYHSTDIGEIDGKNFDRIICAGVTAVKWWANANAEADLAGIERLIFHLDQADATRFVLISTVDVYADPVGVDETDKVPAPGLHPYGRHRAMLEQWVSRRFERHHIIRLPALFGTGLKKNAVFDLINDNRLSFIDPASQFQWYPLARLASDIAMVQSAGVPVINLVTEPIAMETIRQRFFPDKALGGQSAPVAYDVKTRHGRLFGGNAEYAMRAPDVMTALAQYLGVS